MRGGGWNAENSQASDARRVVSRKCRDCSNTVRTRTALLCLVCNQRAFEARQQSVLARARASKKNQTFAASDSVSRLSSGLSGLLNFWLSDHRNAGVPDAKGQRVARVDES